MFTWRDRRRVDRQERTWERAETLLRATVTFEVEAAEIWVVAEAPGQDESGDEGASGEFHDLPLMSLFE